MGTGNSKIQVCVARGQSLFLHCTLDKNISAALPIPNEVVRRFNLELEKYVVLKDCAGGEHCCELVSSGDAYKLTNGWPEFLHQAGAMVGDCLVFHLKGAGRTVVVLFPKSGCNDLGGENEGGRGGGGGTDGAYSDPRGAATPISTDMVFSSAVANTSSQSPGGRGGVDVLAVWRGHIMVGRGVQLERWMVEGIAVGMSWEMPGTKIYVGRVDGTSIGNSRLRLPRQYTQEQILPLMTASDEVFVLQGRLGAKTTVKFSICKDGRAAFTQGWREFASAAGLKAGSILAFSFTRRESGLEVDIDVLKI